MRLRSVRMKNGGAKITVLNNVKAEPQDNLVGLIQRHARVIAGHDSTTGRLDGYIIIGLFDNGHVSSAFRMPERLPPTLATSYLNEIIRRELVTENTARAVFDEKFEWVE